MDEMVAQVLQSGMATLLELKRSYSLEDLYNIWEAGYTNEANKYNAREQARREAAMRRKQ